MIKNVNANISKLKKENYIIAVSSLSTIVFGLAITIPGIYNIAMPTTVLSSTILCDFATRKVKRKIRK